MNKGCRTTKTKSATKSTEGNEGRRIIRLEEEIKRLRRDVARFKQKADTAEEENVALKTKLKLQDEMISTLNQMVETFKLKHTEQDRKIKEIAALSEMGSPVGKGSTKFINEEAILTEYITGVRLCPN